MSILMSLQSFREKKKAKYKNGSEVQTAESDFHFMPKCVYLNLL